MGGLELELGGYCRGHRGGRARLSYLILSYRKYVTRCLC